jgi:hypothetical protein
VRATNINHEAGGDRSGFCVFGTASANRNPDDSPDNQRDILRNGQLNGVPALSGSARPQLCILLDGNRGQALVAYVEGVLRFCILWVDKHESIRMEGELLPSCRGYKLLYPTISKKLWANGLE